MADLTAHIQQQIRDSLTVKQELLQDENLLQMIATVALKITETYRNGGRVFLAGNGGSAADAQHLAAELVNQFYFKRPALAAMALTTDTSVLTAISNDNSYEAVFARQLEAHGAAGDVFIGISTSGNSANVVRAMETCHRQGLYAVGLTGKNGGKVAAGSDVCLQVPSVSTPRIQEAHILIGHIICGLVEEQLFGATD